MIPRVVTCSRVGVVITVAMISAATSTSRPKRIVLQRPCLRLVYFLLSDPNLRRKRKNCAKKKRVQRMMIPTQIPSRIIANNWMIEEKLSITIFKKIIFLYYMSKIRLFNVFMLIYLEKSCIKNPLAQKIISSYTKPEVLLIDNYKNIFDKNISGKTEKSIIIAQVNNAILDAPI